MRLLGKNNMKPYIVFLLTALLISPALAQIYKNIDEDGNVTYSDKPADDASNEKVDLPAVNTTPGLDLEKLAQQRQQVETRFNSAYKLYLRSPKNGSHLMAHQRDLHIEAAFEVSVRSNSPEQSKIDEVKQAAIAGAQIKIYMDGQLLPSQDGKATVKEIFRGEHKIEARLVNSNGKQLTKPAKATIWVHRPRAK
ncbi:DUF4124 domain-containing protein [uncultured Pseudoteredinibacter sp.]|uniref:DUF4124 domain-containing protein n=1 Tax=uncultured Pseudoteredinibacter sp. TaxID=1641701 RepID=UPI00262D346B|nr:DUF4124 domain-containing protein [uncultured Pseudoteredinibacter sp.]